MLKLETGCFNPGDAKSASRTRLNQFSAGYFRAGSVASQAAQAPEDSGPEGRTEPMAAHSVSDGVLERAHLRALKDGGLGLGGDGGLHDRLLSLLKARATFALGLL